MNVLVLAQYFPPDMGGGSTRASNVVKGLLKKSCNITVIAAFPHYPHGKIPEQYKHKPIVPEKFGNAQVYRVWIPALPHSNITNRIILHLCFIVSSLFAIPFIGKTDVVWGANPNLFSFYPSYFYSLIKYAPLVRNVDDLWPEVFYELGYVKSNFAQKILDFLAWISYILPAVITPISMGYKRNIVSKYKINPKKIHVIEVGIDEVKPLSNCTKSGNYFTVMYSGALGLGYDFNIILQAARILNKEPVLFIIRGVGELAPKLKKSIDSLGIKNVILNDAFLPSQELVTLLESADAMILPMAKTDFIDSGLPTKVFEYQSFGKPVICVSNGEAARYIKATRSGLVVNPDNPTGLATAVIKLYSDKSISAQFGRNGYDYISKNFTSKNIGEQMYNLFKLATLNQ